MNNIFFQDLQFFFVSFTIIIKVMWFFVLYNIMHLIFKLEKISQDDGVLISAPLLRCVRCLAWILWYRFRTFPFTSFLPLRHRYQFPIFPLGCLTYEYIGLRIASHRIQYQIGSCATILISDRENRFIRVVCAHHTLLVIATFWTMNHTKRLKLPCNHRIFSIFFHIYWYGPYYYIYDISVFICLKKSL